MFSSPGVRAKMWYNISVTLERFFLFLGIDPLFCKSLECDSKSEEAGQRVFA